MIHLISLTWLELIYECHIYVHFYTTSRLKKNVNLLDSIKNSSKLFTSRCSFFYWIIAHDETCIFIFFVSNKNIKNNNNKTAIRQVKNLSRRGKTSAMQYLKCWTFTNQIVDYMIMIIFFLKITYNLRRTVPRIIFQISCNIICLKVFLLMSVSISWMHFDSTFGARASIKYSRTCTWQTL